MNVFGIELLVDLAPGSGEKMKAVLLQNARGVLVCKTNHHKKIVMENLRKFVAASRLAPLASVPEKPAECAKYESLKAQRPAAPAPVPVLRNIQQQQQLSQTPTASVVQLPSVGVPTTAVPPISSSAASAAPATAKASSGGLAAFGAGKL